MSNYYYFNILYTCNNNCVFCFSHSTQIKNKSVISAENIKKIIADYHIDSNDHIVINGGEPTVHTEIKTIISLFKETGAEVILFTNGRKFCDSSFCRDILANTNRVVIPIHGEHDLHNRITQSSVSFDETCTGIQNIIQNGYIDKLEVKFIITKDMINSGFSIEKFISEFDNNLNIVMCGMIQTPVATENNYKREDDAVIGDYLSKELKGLLFRKHGYTKIADICIKYLDKELLNYINNLPLKYVMQKYSSVFFDGCSKDGKIINYDNENKCTDCEYSNICRSVLNSPTALIISNNCKGIVWE